MNTYLVGGAVRDELLGLPVRERDYLVTGASEAQMLALGFRRLDSAFPVFLHPDTGDEYALARTERKVAPGYKGFEVDAGPQVTLEQDLARRDLTINALARDADGDVIDLFHGREDLEAGILRHISPAFVEDPVRLLRIARFAAVLGRWGFKVAHGTFGLLKQMARAEELTTVVPDRLREELRKALAAEQPWRFFETLHRCGALERLIPDLAATLGEEGGHGSGDLPPPLAALRRAAGLTEDPAARLAALAGSLSGPGSLIELVPDRDARELARWSLQWPAAAVARLDAEGTLALLEGVRAFHHPERLERLGQVWAAVDPGRAQSARGRVLRALDAAAAITGASAQLGGLKGPDLGREIRGRRREAVAEALAASVLPNTATDPN